MTHPLSPSAFLSVTGTRISNSTHGEADECFSAEIQHAFEAEATGDKAASGNKPSCRVPAANESNNTATRNKTNTATENKTTRSDQKPAGASKASCFGLFGQGAISLFRDTNPRNPFRPPIPGTRPDGSAVVEGTAGAFTDVTPKIRGTADVKVLTKGALHEQRAEYSTLATGLQVTRKSSSTELTGRFEHLVVYNGPFKQASFEANNLSASVTHRLGKSTAGPANWEPRIAVSVTALRRWANLPSREYVSFQSKVSGKVARLSGEIEYAVNKYTNVTRVDTLVTGRAAVTFDYGKANKEGLTLGVELKKQNLPGPNYGNVAVFARFEFGRREKRF